MATAHRFNDEQIAQILTALNIERTALIKLEDDENLEITIQSAEGKPLVVYVSAEKQSPEAELAVVTIDVFLDDNSLDNEEAYLDSISNDGDEMTVEQSLKHVLQEFLDLHIKPVK